MTRQGARRHATDPTCCHWQRNVVQATVQVPFCEACLRVLLHAGSVFWAAFGFRFPVSVVRSHNL